jgi:hypothetical protein
VRNAALLGTVPPFLLKTDDNPEGVDGKVFDDIESAIVTDRISDQSVAGQVNGALLGFLAGTAAVLTSAALTALTREHEGETHGVPG